MFSYKMVKRIILMTVLLGSYVSFAKVVPLVSIVEKDTGNVTNLTLYTNNLGHIEKLRVKSIIRSQWGFS